MAIITFVANATRGTQNGGAVTQFVSTLTVEAGALIDLTGEPFTDSGDYVIFQYTTTAAGTSSVLTNPATYATLYLTSPAARVTNVVDTGSTIVVTLS